MTRSGLALAAAMTVVALPTSASPKDTGMATVRGLADFCAAKPGTEKASACAGFVAGVMALESLAHADINAQAAFCPPETNAAALMEGSGRMFTAIQSVAHAKPEVQNAPALFGVIAAGRIAFPCPGDTG